MTKKNLRILLFRIFIHVHRAYTVCTQIRLFVNVTASEIRRVRLSRRTRYSVVFIVYRLCTAKTRSAHNYEHIFGKPGRFRCLLST